MIWGMTTSTFTLVHVWLSLIGIGAGLVVMLGLLAGKARGGWTTLFLITTAATSITGFAFPFDHLLPSHKVGIVSLAVLAFTLLARYGFRLAGPWRCAPILPSTSTCSWRWCRLSKGYPF